MSSKRTNTDSVERRILRQGVADQHLADHIEAAVDINKRRNAEVQAVLGSMARMPRITVPSMGGARKK